MRSFRWFGVAAIAAAAVVFLGADATGPKPEPTRSAVCDVHKVMLNYKRMLDLRDRVEMEDRDFKAEAKRRADVVEQMLKQLADLKKDSPDYAKLDQKVWEKTFEVRSYQEIQQNRLDRELRDGLQGGYEDLLAEVAAYARETGLDLVHYIGQVPLDSARNMQDVEQIINSRRIVYNSPQVDISDAVMARLNAKYKPAAVETPKPEPPKPETLKPEAPKPEPGR